MGFGPLIFNPEEKGITTVKRVKFISAITFVDRIELNADASKCVYN